MRASNRQAESLITNALFRIAMERQRTVESQDTFTLQEAQVCRAIEQSSISKDSSELYLGKNTIFTNRYQVCHNRLIRSSLKISLRKYTLLQVNLSNSDMQHNTHWRTLFKHNFHELEE